MRALNRVVLMIVVLLAAAAMAAFLRAKGDSHRLGGAIDLAGSLNPVVAEFNQSVDHPRLLMILAPACPVCLEGAEAVHHEVLAQREDLRALVVWMEVSGEAFRDVLDWPADSSPWSVYLFYPPGVTWDAEPPPPTAWFHQREVADASRFRTGEDLKVALEDAAKSL